MAAGGGCRGGAGFGEVGARGGQCASLGGPRALGERAELSAGGEG
jgi:hypothetical protein